MTDDAPLLPPWMWSILRDFLRAGSTGQIVINTNEGEPLTIACTRHHRKPRDPAGQDPGHVR